MKCVDVKNLLSSLSGRKSPAMNMNIIIKIKVIYNGNIIFKGRRNGFSRYMTLGLTIILLFLLKAYI
jgi:hypothetical protein